MRFNKTTSLVAASCLAMLLLILFQVSWLQHSRRLIEEQFDQKVTMALCSAVEDLSREQSGDMTIHPVGCNMAQGNCCFKSPDATTLQTALSSSLQRYDIDLDFRFDVIPDSFVQLAQSSAYCASMNPLTMDNHAVQVSFANKEQYVIHQLGLMIGSSIFILLFVSGMLLVTLVKFLRQKQLNAVSTDFFNNMAHEFRTPLTNMQLALNLFKKRQPDSSDSKFLQIIQNENQRLLEQVERILHVSKLDKGEYQLEIELIDLKELVQEVLQDMKFQIAEKGGAVQIQPPKAENIVIQGDRLHLSNSIRNIIDNALKYCDQTPNIVIRIESDRKNVSLYFQDNGIGIGEHQKRLVFEKFRRVMNGNIYNEKGFGLGLAYVKQIIERHGGIVRFESELTKGSTFSLVLPIKSVARA